MINQFKMTTLPARGAIILLGDLSPPSSAYKPSQAHTPTFQHVFVAPCTIQWGVSAYETWLLQN